MTKNRNNAIVSGSKGKGGGGSYRAPVEALNSLQSIQYVNLVDVVSEGPIVGLYDGDKSIYMNETPLRTGGGSLTLNDVSWSVRLGTPDQSALPYNSGSESEVGVGAEVTNLYPKGQGPDRGKYQFSITNDLVTRLRITLGVQSLYRTLTDQDHAGDIVEASVSYRILIQDADGKTVKDYSRTLSGKTTSQYLFSLMFDLSGSAPWLVTVYKESQDSSTATLQNDLYISSYTEIVGYSFSYPNTALVSISASAESFSGSVPSRVYRVKGLKIRVPSNYNPETRIYSGVWDGTFKLAWTDNPAWVLYDIISNDRYGVAKYLPLHFMQGRDLCDKWFLYEIAQLCDVMVPDGHGGTEPRFTFNGQIMGAGDAKEVMQSIASVFHGMTYWSSGLIYARSDYPNDPVRTITQANIIGGKVTYGTGSMQERHSVALVTWYDPDDMGRAHIEAVYDWELYKQLGYRPIESVAYGCYSRGQANRHGLWLLASESDQWTATVEMGLDAFDLVPGDIVRLADPAWMAYRASGRIKGISADGFTVTLDAPLELSSGVYASLSICDADGKEETRAITSVSGSAVFVAEAFTHDFVESAVWSVSSAEAEPRQFRIQNIKETDKATVQLTLTEFNPNKYQQIEYGLKLEDPPYRAPLKSEVQEPVNLKVMESTARVNGRMVEKALFSWSLSQFGVTQFRVRTTDPLGNRKYSSWIDSSSYELSDVSGGSWAFEVQARTFDGRVSAWARLDTELAGMEAANPSNVKTLTLEEWGYMQRDGVHISNVTATWEPPAMSLNQIECFEVWYRYSASASWQLYMLADRSETQTDITNVLTGRKLSVMVKVRSVLSVSSSGVTQSLDIVGKDAIPTTPGNFAVSKNPLNRAELLCSWDAIPDIDCNGYRIYLNSVIAVNQTFDTQAAVTVAKSGEYKIDLVSIDNSGQLSKKTSQTLTVLVLPDDVTGLKAEQSSDDKSVVILSWDAVPGEDISHYEIRQGISWDDSIIVTPKELLTSTQARITAEGSYTWWVVAWTTANKRSQCPQSVSGTFSLKPSPPSNLSVSQDLYDSTRLVISWVRSPDPDVVSYEVRNGFVWSEADVMTVTAENRLTLTIDASQDFAIRVRAKNSAGFESPEIAVSYSADLEPSNVTGFQAVQDGGSIDFLWNKNPETDISGYEIREGSSWESANVVATGITQTEAAAAVTVERTYKYLIKAVNRAGYESPLAASASVPVEALPPKNVIAEWDDIDLQDGTHDGTVYTENPVTWQTAGGTFADYPDVKWSEFGGELVLMLASGTTGVWESPVRDLGRIVSANLAADFVRQVRAGSTAVLQYRTSQDGEIWTPYRIFTPHQERLRYVQYRIVFTAPEGAEAMPYVTILIFIVDMPDVVKSGRISVAGGGTEISYGFEFAVPPVVVITADGAQKRAVLVGTPETTKCAVQVVDAAGADVGGVVNWTAYGY